MELMERVIKGLECCLPMTARDGVGDCKNCPYDRKITLEGGITECCHELMGDALALLEAQESPTDASISSAIECLLHPQDADDSDMAKAIDTAVCAMKSLKAQEPVEPTLRGGIGGYWYCGACNYQISRGDKFCRYCGQAVKWE